MEGKCAGSTGYYMPAIGELRERMVCEEFFLEDNGAKNTRRTIAIAELIKVKVLSSKCFHVVQYSLAFR